MFRRLMLVTLGALLLGAPVAAHAGSTAATAPSGERESGNPINDQGGNYNYRSVITSITPHVAGLQLEVLEFADRLVLRNHTGRTVTVFGYQGEQYARVLPDGTVEVNTTSPAYYLNQNFYGDVNVPSFATATATPRWSVIDRTGEMEWHDHRIHWMSPALPPQVKHKSKRALIFDWQVPIAVGSQRATVEGQLFWVPEEGTSTPVGAIVAGVAIVLAGIAFVLFVRRRRNREPMAGGPAGPPSGDPPGVSEAKSREAW
jgi:LPXTG-motif cell wall-anchored protein